VSFACSLRTCRVEPGGKFFKAQGVSHLFAPDWGVGGRPAQPGWSPGGARLKASAVNECPESGPPF
jgi:hypothetical protein